MVGSPGCEWSARLPSNITPTGSSSRTVTVKVRYGYSMIVGLVHHERVVAVRRSSTATALSNRLLAKPPYGADLTFR